MKWISFVVIVGLSAAVVSLEVKNRILRTRIRDVDASWKRMAMERVRPTHGRASYSERMLFVAACNEVMTSCKDGVCPGLRKYRDFLAENAPCVSADNAEAVGEAMFKTIQESFIFARELEEFEDVEQFRHYSNVNYDFAMYLGELHIRRGEFELSTAKESLSYYMFSEYRDHFHSIGRLDMELVAADYLHRLAKHIESQDGFVRRCIRHLVWLNTEYAELMRPGKGMSKTDSIKFARGYAKVLTNVGYKPKWLDVEYPSPDSDNEQEGVRSAQSNADRMSL